MFGKRSADESGRSSVQDDEVTVTTSPAAEPKGRPTPSRKEAEAARKAALTGKPKPGATKKEVKAASRQQAHEARAKNREAMMRGDQRALPVRDQGPVRAFVRDFVDSRRTVAEYFVPVAVVVLVLGLFGTNNLSLQRTVTLFWFLILILVIFDTAFLMFRLNQALRKKWPNPAERKGVAFYAIMRALQIRRLRLPPARFKAGGRPITPNAPKG